MKKILIGIIPVFLLFSISCKKSQERIYDEHTTETITIKVDHDTSFCMHENQTIVLDASGIPNAIDWSWGSSLFGPIIAVQSPGDYSVTITDVNGNMVFYNIWIDFCEKSSTIFYPNSFTPNGDGINDFWYITCTNIDPNNFSLKIYNSNNSIMFDTDDMTLGWNGYYENENNK